MKNTRIFLCALLVGLGLTSCNDDDDAPEVINEEEVITTVEVTLRAPDGTAVVYTSRDADGEGPDAPVITNSGNLMQGTSYVGTISFLNETETPTEDITAEVEEEADEHQVFFTPSSSLLVTVATTNVDGNNNPLGTEFTLDSDSASIGTLTVTLRHEPMKPNDGSLNDAGGETDVQVTFPITVE